MRSRTTLLLLALCAVGVAELTAQRAVPDQPTFVPGQVIVKMRTAVSLSANRLQALGLDSTFRQTGGAGEFVYQIPPALVGAMAATVARDRTLAVVDSLRAEANVEYAQPNYRLYAIGAGLATRDLVDIVPNDARFAEQWHYHNNGTGAGESPGGINLPRAWDTSTGSNSISVSVLDTGILPNHPDITGSGNLATGYDMITDLFTANDGDGRDADPTDPGDALVTGECGGLPPWPPINLPASWHGTHVSGTIGVGNTNNGVGVAGVNWSVSVQAVRVLGKCGGSTADINDGIRWAAGLPVPGVPNNTSPARVINMSLGTPPGAPCTLSPSTQSAIDDAVAAGAVVVVAAGNDAVDASQVFPASCNNVITVAASDANGDLETEYSNFGSTVEIMAPGGDVTPNAAGGVLSMVQAGYAFYNGTSMAAPHVAGVAALWLSVDPSLTPTQLLTALQAATMPRTSSQCPQPCGAGLLNAIGGPISPMLAVAVSLADDDIKNNETTTATATVTLDGSPQAGKSVDFDTGDPGVATIVPPASSVTGADGKATATVRGVDEGTTDVTASTNGAVGSVPIEVPSLSTIAIVLLALAMLIAASLRKSSAFNRKYACVFSQFRDG